MKRNNSGLLLHQLIQLIYEISNDNLQRKVDGLMAAMQFFNVAKGVIVTMHQSELIEKDSKVIEVLPAHEFLMR